MPAKKKKAAAPKKAVEQKSEKSKVKHMPLRITDTTLRDAHQSLWATRLRTDDILDIIDVVDNAGYYSLECWGGATFDVCMRFLRENPWERLRQIKARAKKTPLQMLLRGQNVLGYQNYPDDLLDRFISLSVENGMDIFRIFDALNDTRNLEYAIKCVKANGAHAQGTICYTISPVHTVENFVQIAREQEQMGADSICIKDMAGILSPIRAKELISALVKEVNVPIQVHSHMTSGMAVATYTEAVCAGAGAIDCAISSMSGFSSQPPVETMLSIFGDTDFGANLDVDALRKINKYFLSLKPSRGPKTQPKNIIDPEVLLHHIPGGMISNLCSQLEQQDALDRLEDVMLELPKARKDLGYPPLVTPTSQIVGVQAVLNVLSGERYSMVTNETKQYVRGFYGRSPAPMDPKIKKQLLDGASVIKGRPADLLEPMLPTATKDVDPDLIRSEEDIISYCLFPEPALAYFKWRNTPLDQRDPIPADLERAAMKADVEEPAQPFLAKSDYAEIDHLMQKVNQLGFTELTIRRNDLNLSVKGQGHAVGQVAVDAPVASAPVAAAAPVATAAAPAAAAAVDGPTVNAPLNGTFYRSNGPGKPNFAEEGDSVKAGTAVCIVEAMKLFNQIKVENDCKIVKFLVEHGDSVSKGQALAIISE